MTKIEQMDEFAAKVKQDEELQKELVAVLQSENSNDTAEADKWLADNGYSFTVQELGEHLQDGVPLTEEELDAVAGGEVDPWRVFLVRQTSMLFNKLDIEIGVLACFMEMKGQ